MYKVWENNWLVSHHAEQWIDLEIMEGVNIDSESGISFASIDSDRFKKMVKM